MSPLGTEDAAIQDIQRAARLIAQVRAFLHSCVDAIDGDYALDRLFLPRPDGEPLRLGGWAWHGLAVPFEHREQRFRIGIFQYEEAPSGEEAATTLLWLEVFPGEENEALVSLPFVPAGLAADTLAPVRKRFVAAWQSAAPL